MMHCELLRVTLRMSKLLVGLALVLGLVGCSLGEAVLPSPATGVPADRAAGVVAPVPNPIPHSLERRDECFACHATGAVDAPPVPVGHEEDLTRCTTCHAVWLAPAIAAAAPPAIPHPVEGRGDCLVCHKVGTSDAPRVPDNHSGLTSDMCQTCHTQATTLAGVVGEEAEPSVVEAPSIPHGQEGFTACTGCHEEGGGGIPPFPEDHRGRTNDLCSACHRPSVEKATTTPVPEPTVALAETPSAPAGDAVHGQVIFDANCAACHGPNGEGTAIAPDALNDASLLAGLTDENLESTIRMGVDGEMPAMPNLSDQDVADLVALLRSWQ